MTAIAWGAKVSPQFLRKVHAISDRLGIETSWLMACMAFETGERFTASVRNKVSRATGLIQFMPKTAISLGTTIDSLAKMTAEDQLDYVEKYFHPYAEKLHSIDDVYMTILWPAAVGKPETYVLFNAGDPKTATAYKQNSGLDKSGDGTVTKAEAAGAVRVKLRKGGQPGFVGELEEEEGSITSEDELDDEVVEEVALTKTEITAAQQMLYDLDYFEVGLPDGDFGGKTAAAVAAFRLDRKVPGPAELDRDLIVELENAKEEKEAGTWERPIAEERKHGKPADSRIIESAERQTTVTTTGGATIGGGGLLWWLSQKYEGVKDIMHSPIVKPFVTLVQEYWWVLMIAGAIYYVYENRVQVKARVDDFQKGKIT